MQSKTVKNDMVLLPVPMELFDEIGIEPMDAVQMSIADGKIIIEKVTDADFVCDGDCNNCPFDEEDCDGDCESCPCNQECDESDNYDNE